MFRENESNGPGKLVLSDEIAFEGDWKRGILDQDGIYINLYNKSQLDQFVEARLNEHSVLSLDGQKLVFGKPE